MNKLTKLLIGLALADLLAAIDSTAVNVAMPKISHFFNLTPNMVSWMQTLYILALIIILIPAGKVGDMRGHKRNFLAGLVIFGLASLGIIFIDNYLVILIFRIIQGTAAAVLYTASGALIAHNWEKTEAAFGMTAAFFSLGLLIGPIIGGILSDLQILNWQGWHLIFAINIPVVLACYWLVSKNCSETKKAEGALRLDLVGLALLTILLGSIIVLLTQKYYLGVLIMAIVSLILLIWYENKRENALINLSIFKNQTFSAISVFTLMCMFIVIGLSFVNTFYIQDVLGKSATTAGLYLMPIFLGMGLFAFLSGQYRNWKISTIAASVLIIISMFILSKVNPDIPYFKGLFWGYLLVSAGGGLMMTNTFAAALGSVKKQFSGLASGYINTTQQMGALAGISFVAGQNILVNYQKIYYYFIFIGIIALVATLFVKNIKAEKNG